jgi:ATP-dependent Lon protease
VARSLSREFIRASLGGVRDEAEIRGHRRTYIGALPGRIIQGMRRVGTRNPVFMLDEIDKLGADFRGDPAAALLEVLDPEQNNVFSDHYLEVNFDLSSVIFIATANTLETIPPALLDRMEVLEIPGYTRDEKLEIAKRHLVPKQIAEHGLGETQINFDEESLTTIIEQYTREAGVRNLEREVANVIRAVAVKVAENEPYQPKLDPAQIADFLGPQKFFSEVAERTEVPGVATGLAWMPTGGDILFIEASQMPGKGNLILTGHLGDVMKESARAALSWVRTHVEEFNLNPDFEKLDVHLHVPAGAVSKDGPSAGVAMIVALASLFTGRRVRGDVAMTGEITLRGSVLPVGGIKEKVLAAHRAGIRRVILPDRNRKDMVDIPESVRKDLELVFVKRIQEALELTLEAVPVVAPGPDSSTPEGTAARA